MPKSPKNLQPDAPGASDATANARNSVESILSLTDEEILLRFQSLTQDELRDLVPVLRATMYVFAMR